MWQFEVWRWWTTWTWGTQMFEQTQMDACVKQMGLKLRVIALIDPYWSCYIYIYYIFIYTHMFTCIHVYIYTYIHIHIHMLYIYIYIYAHVHSKLKIYLCSLSWNFHRSQPSSRMAILPVESVMSGPSGHPAGWDDEILDVRCWSICSK